VNPLAPPPPTRAPTSPATPPLLLLQILRAWIPNPILIDRKQTITLRQTRAIINLTNPRLAPPLLQTQPRRTRMRDDIPPNRLLRIRIKHGTRPTIDLRNHLIGNNDSNTELIRQPLQGAHELGEVRLARRQLAAADEVGAVQRRGRVDDEQGEARLAHHGRGLVQQLQLVVRVVGARVGHVVEHLLAREAVAVGDGEEAHGPEGALRVDVQALALAAAHVEGQLARHGEGVADLTLARAELAEDLGDAARFDAPGEERVELLRAGCDGDEFAAALVHFGGGCEAHGD